METVKDDYGDVSDELVTVEYENRPLSTQFSDMNVAIAACATKRSVCGKKRHFLYDNKSLPIKFSVGFKPEDT